jgi:hypothetical protein
MSMKKRPRGLHPYESTPEEMEFYRRISGCPITVARAARPEPRQKPQPPKREEEPSHLSGDPNAVVLDRKR